MTRVTNQNYIYEFMSSLNFGSAHYHTDQTHLPSLFISKELNIKI